MRSGSLCALLWRLLCWCNLRHVVLKARHISGCLNVIADKLSRQGQIIQTEWSSSGGIRPPVSKAIKEQGFSSPVALRIEAPQRRSTRTVYEAKRSVFMSADLSVS